MLILMVGLKKSKPGYKDTSIQKMVYLCHWEQRGRDSCVYTKLLGLTGPVNWNNCATGNILRDLCSFVCLLDHGLQIGLPGPPGPPGLPGSQYGDITALLQSKKECCNAKYISNTYTVCFTYDNFLILYSQSCILHMAVTLRKQLRHLVSESAMEI